MSSAIFSFNNLGSLTGVISRVAEDVVNEAAQVAEEYAVTHVQVLTGETQRSIRTETDGNSVNLLADGAALYLEYGTVHMRAFPFMRPAMDAAEGQIDPSHLKSAFEGESGA